MSLSLAKSVDEMPKAHEIHTDNSEQVVQLVGATAPWHCNGAARDRGCDAGGEGTAEPALTRRLEGLPAAAPLGPAQGSLEGGKCAWGVAELAATSSLLPCQSHDESLEVTCTEYSGSRVVKLIS